MSATTSAEVSRPEAAPTTTRSSRLVAAVTHGPAAVALAIVAVIWLVPTIGLLVSSFRSATDNASSGWWTALTAPAQLTLQPYRNLLEDSTMVDALLNTVLITVPASLLVVAVSSLAAYAFAWTRFRGRDVLFLIVVGLLVVPIQVALIPVARLYDVLGLFGTIPGVVLFHVAFGLPFAIFLLRNFFVGLPHELLEAARMDGAGGWQLFRRITLPLLSPTLLFLGVITTIGYFQFFAEPYVMTDGGKPLNATLSVGLLMYKSGFRLWNMGYGAAVAFVLFLVVLGLTSIQLKLQGRQDA